MKLSSSLVLTAIVITASACTAIPIQVPPPHVQANAYIVKRGDTIQNIAWRYQVLPNDLVVWNNLKKPFYLNVGQRLRVRGNRSQIQELPVQPSPTVASISRPKASQPQTQGVTKVVVAQATPVELQVQQVPVALQSVGQAQAVTQRQAPKPRSLPIEIEEVPASISSNHVSQLAPLEGLSDMVKPISLSDDSNVGFELSQWVWPAQGDFKSKKIHIKDKGPVLDILGTRGQSVVAASTGEVIYTGGDSPLGRLIILRHDGGFISAYSHNERLNVRKGDQVFAGDVIAYMGGSGEGSAKLRFQLKKEGQTVDPLVYLPRIN